ncbi:MAG: hypothetical protein LBH26_07985 [Treponema sp.]|nr:hypothetical protein [Treponema sp.]
MIQFGQQGVFTRQVGNMQINGRYKAGDRDAATPDGYPVTGKLSVFFGGVEFRLAGDEAEGLFLSAASESESAALPEYMRISGDTAVFRFSGGGELSFTSIDSGGNTELRIQGDFPPDVEGFLLPYMPLRSSRVQDTGNGLPIISANGQDYSFNRAVPEKARGLLLLEAGGPPLSYGAVPEKAAFNPADYSLDGALSRQSYGAAIQSWRDSRYALWARLIQGQNDEELVVAFLGEAAGRGTYQNAKSLVPSAFLNGNRRAYGSSSYLGGIARTYPGLGAADRERLSRLSGLIDEGSPEIFREDGAFEYLALRGSAGLTDRAAALLRGSDPAGLGPELLPGMLEAISSVKQSRPREDPFGDLPERICALISGQLQRVPGAWNSGQGLVLVFRDGSADAEFNLRLGKALAAWAENAGDEAWAAIGRSLVLSVLSLADGEGKVPARFSLAEPAGPEDTQTLDPLRIYRILQPGEYYPRIAATGIDGIWIWSSSPSVSAARENGMLDISVSFPAGETHYLMIWGLQPFTRLQLHNMDWRSDPRYESYDSSGWVYYAQDGLLALKLKHRAQVEHIRIFSSQAASAAP